MSTETLSAGASLSALLHGGVPLIAVSFSDRTPRSDVERAKAEGLDIAELRIDRYSSHDLSDVLAEVRSFAGFHTIATIRIAAERGDWTGSEANRLGLFMSVLPEVDAIDIELAATEILPELVAAAKGLGKVVIISNHNFTETPPQSELETMAERAKGLGADLVKLSAWAKSWTDIRCLASFTLQHAELGLIVIAMGPRGGVSRVFFPALGSRVTYAHIDEHPVSGQLTFTATFDELRRFFPEFNEKKIIELQLLDGA